jgi:hypothetical protein
MIQEIVITDNSGDFYPTSFPFGGHFSSFKEKAVLFYLLHCKKTCRRIFPLYSVRRVPTTQGIRTHVLQELGAITKWLATSYKDAALLI